MTDPKWVGRDGRRSFLKILGAVPAAVLATQGAVRQVEAAAETAKLPHIQIGSHSFSRLICGANPFNGGSHLSVLSIGP